MELVAYLHPAVVNTSYPNNKSNHLAGLDDRTQDCRGSLMVRGSNCRDQNIDNIQLNLKYFKEFDAVKVSGHN